jgi:hypothetical protein
MHQWIEIPTPAGAVFPVRTFRMRVPGGWLYRYADRTMRFSRRYRISPPVFVPDQAAGS